MTPTLPDKIILDLCGGTGAWSKPYRDAGYDVRVWTLPDVDVTKVVLQELPKPLYGVFAAPPCTHFSVSGAQYWKAKDRDGRTEKDLDIVDACLDIIEYADPYFWALENPVGRLSGLRGRRMGEPVMTFDPYEFAGWSPDPESNRYTKKTLLWGNFWPPQKKPLPPIRVCGQGSWIMKLGGKSEHTKELRSRTPDGFARAFYEANI
jgi:hypothetical protein